jgi:5-bromo-4-chloroindolyl phosphate hydrolysis protein
MRDAIMGMIWTLLIIGMIVTIALSIRNREGVVKRDISTERIKLKAETLINEKGYRIIEVDSVEYLVTDRGVCPLVK